MTFDTMTRPQLEMELRRCNDVMVADGKTIGALTEQIDELHQQDRLKTREINTLVPENRNLIAQRDGLRTVLLAVTEYAEVQVESEVHEDTEAEREMIARAYEAYYLTAPVNPNAGVGRGIA